MICVEANASGISVPKLVFFFIESMKQWKAIEDTSVKL